MANFEVLAGYLGSMPISSVVSLASYLLTAFGIYNMGKTLGVKNPWLSFIPFANVYAFGNIAEHYIKRDGRPSAKFSKILLTLNIIILVLTLVLVTALLVGFVFEAISNPDINAYFESEEFASAASYTLVLPIVLGMFAICGLAIAYMVVTYVALWRIYFIFDSETATVYLILSIFFNFLQPIFLFILRNREPQIFMPVPFAQEETENIM